LFSGDQGPSQQKKSSRKTDVAGVLQVLANGETSATEIARSLGKTSVTGSLKRILRELLECGRIEYTIPEKPASRLRKYRVTKGYNAVA